MSEPEELKAFIPTTPDAQAAYYTACLAIDISQELCRLLKKQCKTRAWLEDQLGLRSIAIDEVDNLEYVARMFLPLGYHLEVKAVKNEETEHE